MLIHTTRSQPLVIKRTQDTGPAYERMRLPLARGPLDPLTTAVHSHGKSSGRETHLHVSHRQHSRKVSSNQPGLTFRKFTPMKCGDRVERDVASLVCRPSALSPTLSPRQR